MQKPISGINNAKSELILLNSFQGMQPGKYSLIREINFLIKQCFYKFKNTNFVVVKLVSSNNEQSEYQFKRIKNEKLIQYKNM